MSSNKRSLFSDLKDLKRSPDDTGLTELVVVEMGRKERSSLSIGRASKAAAAEGKTILQRLVRECESSQLAKPGEILMRDLKSNFQTADGAIRQEIF